MYSHVLVGRWSKRAATVVALAVVLVALAAPALAPPAFADVRVTAVDATAHDETVLAAIARNLEQSFTTQSKLTKKFRLRIPADGGVRGLTELAVNARGTKRRAKHDANHADDHDAKDAVIACKLTRNRLWSAKLRGSGTARTVIVTFTFAP